MATTEGEEEETSEEEEEGEKTGDEAAENTAANESDLATEGTEPDDGLVHDLSYYVQKIAKNLDGSGKDPEEADGVFGSDSDDDIETGQPVDGDVFRPRQMRSLQGTLKKSSAFHERRLRLCRTVCAAAHMNFIDIKSIADFKYLRCVDFGKNYLRDLSPFSDLPFLGTLKLYKNGMGDISSLKSRTLRFLDVTNNKVKNLDGTSFPRICRLKLNFNRIHSLDFLKGQEMKWLRRLELRGNMLKTTAGIRHFFLEELYLAENDIREIEDLEFCPNLKRLHLRDNQILEVTGFSKRSAKLEYVNLRNNLITFIDDAVGVSILPKIKTVVMLDNPVQLEEDFRMVMIARMPFLTTLDKEPILPYDRDWSIMMLMDCLHHEEVDLMVAVSDLIENFHPVDMNTDAMENKRPTTAGTGQEAGEDMLEDGLSVSAEENLEPLADAEDDLDREYWGEKAAGEDGEEDGETGEEEEM